MSFSIFERGIGRETGERVNMKGVENLKEAPLPRDETLRRITNSVHNVKDTQKLQKFKIFCAQFCQGEPIATPWCVVSSTIGIGGSGW